MPPGKATDAGAERRLVSVLFADLVGFTPFAEERDAEDVREILTRYFDLAREVIERYGGHVEKFIGDAVMAVWGAPTAQEDDAERSVRAALDLVDAVTTLGPTIAARAGVMTGEAAVSIGATNQGMVAGDLVNTAARLQAGAEPGTVLVGEATQRSAQGAVIFEEAGDQVLKGKAAPVPAWRAIRVVAQRGGRGRSDTLEAPFVGRDEELRLLKDLFHATTRERRPRLVSVIGAAGIGKSRLAWEFEKYLDGLVETVYWHHGRSPAYGEGITFWALGEMIRGRAGLIESDDEITTRERLAATLGEHITEADERAWVERALLALLGFESGVDTQQLFAAWRTLFERLAAAWPVVMVFEDLHFADPGLLDFIDHLLEWSRSSPITIVTLARPELLEKRPTWGAGKRSFSSIHLEPLPEPAMRELLGGLVPGLPERATDAIVTRADGIPLYAVETVRMLLAQGRLALADGGAYRPTGDLEDIAVPETLTALIAARLDSLEPGDRSLIADAAVLGQSFTPAALAAVSGGERDVLEPRLAGLVARELLLLEVDPRSPERGQFAFVQALIREVAYNTLSKKDRKIRHLAAARYFESFDTDELAGGLAGHYLAAYRLAGEGPEAEALAAQARVALRGAAERAAALGSHVQALTFFEQALGVATDEADRAELHERARSSALESLSADAGMRHAEAAVAARRALGDRPAIARAVAALGRIFWSFRREPDRALEVLLPAWEEFADLEETSVGLELAGGIVSAYTGLDRPDKAAVWLDRLLPLAEKLDDVDALVGGLLSHGHGLQSAGRPREGLLIMRGAHSLAVAHDLWPREAAGRTLLTFWEQWGEPAEGLSLASEGLEIARRIGSNRYGFSMVGNGVVCAIRVGDWDWAADLLAEWIPEEAIGGPYAEFFVDRAILTSLRGGDATADIDHATTLRAGITDPQYESYEMWARAWSAFSARRFVEARTLGLRAAETTSYFHPLAVPLAARASLWAGDADGARGALAILERTMYRGAALAADKVAIRAGILALDGQSAEAFSTYQDALGEWRALKLAWDEALTIIDMAAFLDPTDPEVRATAESTRATLTRLGAQPYVERLEAALVGDARPTSPTDALTQLQTTSATSV
ncbi:MAG TPA: adenylate/guanylate cyclase domain-containing protein [Candidatus Limnocylindrales bacterium]|nr:adenylate/guanylate cyclase domain-containing protein [Candidatus Limnocylindrales bacterium]